MSSSTTTLDAISVTHSTNHLVAASDEQADADSAHSGNDTLDQVWRDIFATATDIVRREPMLERRMQRMVLGRLSLADTVAAILAHKLTCEDMCQSELYMMIYGILEAEKSILYQIAADLTAVKTRDPASVHHLHVLLNMKGFHALQSYRIAHALWRHDRMELALALANKASTILCVDIHPAARIGAGVMLDHGTGLVIGETCVIADNVSILQDVTLGGTGKERGDRHPKIHSGVMIGAGAKILGNIQIGAMSKVAAGSVVLTDVPSYCTVAGVPAKIVRHYLHNNPPAFEMDQSFPLGKSQ